MPKKTNVTFEDWKKLYELSDKIGKLKPWEKLWDTDIVTLFLPSFDEPILCSVIGRNKGAYGIVSYCGSKAINKFHMLLKSQDMPISQLMRYQDEDILICYFGDKQELLDEEIDIVKKLGLKFRGSNSWIYFRSIKKGYVPYLIDPKEAKLEIDILDNLFIVLSDYFSHKINVNFNKGETLTRFYNKDTDKWENYSTPLMIPQINYPRAIIKDDKFTADLNSQKNTFNEIEVDIVYLGEIVNDKTFERPFFLRACMLANHIDGTIINYMVVSPKDNETEALFGITSEYILSLGKPKTIFVRDEYAMNIIKDLCEKTGIDLVINRNLKSIDALAEGFSKFKHNP